jgi:hypothetical protein
LETQNKTEEGRLKREIYHSPVNPFKAFHEEKEWCYYELICPGRPHP